ncbi:MAG TPA: NfeD family protein [Vicinamibacterales bacterium]|nr:NfeD family protein [Vicinamibacterales bacterium]
MLGLLLVVAEMAASGGFYIIFFGIGAIVVGLLASFDLAGPIWMQLLLFSAISVASLLIFRRRLLKWLQVDPQAPPVDMIVGEVGVAAEDLLPGKVGRVELRGAAWSGRNITNVTLARGARCRVIRVDGLTVDVEPEGARS